MSGTNNPNDPGTFDSLCSPSVNNCPSARFETRTTWTRDCDNFLLFGGAGDIQGINMYNDLWNYNVSSNQWTLMNGFTIPNQPGHFGTITVSDTLNMPGSRFGGVGWTDSLGQIWMFGGSTQFGFLYYNDMWKYVIDTMCPAMSPCIGAGIPLAASNSIEISLYPNPNAGNFTLKYHLPQSEIKNFELGIFDVTGRKVYSQPITNQKQSTIQLNQISNGIYYWKMMSDKEIIGTGKIAIMH